MSKMRSIYLHLVKMNLLVDAAADTTAISFSEWIALNSAERYKLKKYYKKNNIKIPTP